MSTRSTAAIQTFTTLSCLPMRACRKSSTILISGPMNRDKINSLLIVHYEDMRTNTADVLARIVEFLGTPGTDDEIQEAVRFASVENMRNMETKRTFWLSGSRMVAKDRKNPNSYKVRKAKVGGYRDYFDDAQIDTMNQLVQKDLDPSFGYKAAGRP